MALNDKEHYALMAQFEKEYKRHLYRGRFDRETDTDVQERGQIYQDGNTNTSFLAFRLGYFYGRAVKRDEVQE